MLPSSEMYLSLIEAEARGPKPKADVWYLTALPLVRNGVLAEAAVVALLGPMPARSENPVVKAGRSATGDGSFVGTSNPLQAGVRPKRTEPCIHLGDFKEERECASCGGRVRLKVYHCRHPAHRETTIANCQRCGDYEARDG